MINRDIKAVLLDLDGTLLDTMPDLVRAHNFCLRSLGFPELTEEEMAKCIGEGIITAIELACPPGTPRDKIMEYHSIYSNKYGNECTVYTRHFPGMVEFLSRCVSAGKKVAVLTNKTEPIAQKIVRHYLPNVPFSFIWGNNNVRPLKPKPDAGLMAAEELSIEPQNIAYVGDSDVDIYFAKNCGMLAVGASWGYRGREELVQAGADLVLDSPEQLLALI